MIELFPQGFEEVDRGDSVELIGYTDAAGEERFLHEFSGARASDVEQGWEERWREFHRPIRVGPLWVGPPWETPPADAVPIVVDPGRAFGTGAHPTTRLCLELLLGLPRGSLVDVGCGSGVLAIAAAALGFAPVVALDLDPAAIEATRANADANGVEVEARLADAFAGELPHGDVTVANISLGSALALGPRLSSPRVITAGYHAGETPDLPGYRIVARADDSGWAADLHEKPA